MKTKKTFTTVFVALLGWALTVGISHVAPNLWASGPGGGGGAGGGGGGGGGNSTQAIANVLKGPWQTLVVDTLLTVTFNNNGSFSANISSASGATTVDSGTWVLLPPVAPSPFTNPQGHLILTSKRGLVLLAGDVLLINRDQLLMSAATDSVSTSTFVPQLVITKLTI
jgi:hypothetical protein